MTETLIVIFVTVSLLALLAITRILTTVIHELGHYISGTILLRGKYEIYIGSFGDPNNSISFKIANLKIYFKYNPILWNHGLCIPITNNTSFVKNFLFILAGPIASIIVIFFCIYILIVPEIYGVIKLGAIFLLFSSIVDVFQNLSPNDTPILLHNGKTTYNDGQSLKILLSNRRAYPEVLEIYNLLNSNKIDEGLILFQKTYPLINDPYLIRLGIVLYVRKYDHESALRLAEELKKIDNFNADDYGNYALIHSHMGNHESALGFYNKSIELNAQNFTSLNNRGYTFNLLGKYQEAIKDFDNALKLDSNFAYAYNNRGLSKIKLGNYDDGLIDINKSFEIDNNNSYAYKNLGIYYLEMGNIENAKELFVKAKELDVRTHGIDELIDTVNEK